VGRKRKQKKKKNKRKRKQIKKKKKNKKKKEKRQRKPPKPWDRQSPAELARNSPVGVAVVINYRGRALVFGRRQAVMTSIQRSRSFDDGLSHAVQR